MQEFVNYPMIAMVQVIIATLYMVLAYIGPGSGLSAIGAFLACFMGILVAILGFLWYPIKRLLGNRAQEPQEPNAQELPERPGEQS